MSRIDGSEGEPDAYTTTTFQAMADAVLPPTFRRNEARWTIVAGANQLCVDRYVIAELDHSQFPPFEATNGERLSRSTARLLDWGAERLLGGGPPPLFSGAFPGGGPFSALPRLGRLQTLDLLDRLELSADELPAPFSENPALVRIIVNSLHQLTYFGYYSGWAGCGEAGWGLVGYPGPSFGYRDFRGFPSKDSRIEGGDTDG
ncbi:hypothetical protein FE782_26000 [Paenibacillus antri]|uniref:Gluconate 2-dehydrogenase subunit 3 family protein n=1 Tax=Paenibacillus antri TaxID=2582848 RepID=A0A5R9G2R8_9BACL|nr:hypothetical protein [Paenibacillus antri]TLS49309.1 hypothetical protein FE782_26000 [Paenibacillus antri]